VFAIVVECFAELGMSDVDQRLGALANGFAMQVSDPIFGNYVADQAARGHHARSGLEHWRNARNGSVLGSGGESDDWLSAPGTGSAPQEIDLTADSAVEVGAN